MSTQKGLEELMDNMKDLDTAINTILIEKSQLENKIVELNAYLTSEKKYSSDQMKELARLNEELKKARMALHTVIKGPRVHHGVKQLVIELYDKGSRTDVIIKSKFFIEKTLTEYLDVHKVVIHRKGGEKD